LSAATVLLVTVAIRLSKITRAEGLLLLLAYGAYLSWLVLTAGLTA